jgi:hypothetical protein
MKNLTADQVLQKTFEHLDQMLGQKSGKDVKKAEKSAFDKKKKATRTASPTNCK